MNRSTKKFLYAFLYLGVFSLAGFLIYFAGNFGNEPSLPEGPQPSPPASDLQVADKQIFRIREASPAFLFGRVRNTSGEKGFRFLYAFSLYGLDGKLLEQVPGEANVLPSSETLLYATAENVLSRDVESVSLEVGNAESLALYEFPVFSLSFSENPRIEVLDDERAIRIRGALRNESGTFVPEARAVAILRDSFGFQAFVSGTVLSRIRSFSEKSFEIPVPYDTDLARRAREGSVEVYFYPVF